MHYFIKYSNCVFTYLISSKSMYTGRFLSLLFLCIVVVHAFRGGITKQSIVSKPSANVYKRTMQLKTTPDDLDETVRKSGLEVGIFKALTSKNKSGVTAKELLTKYGSAYLLTSITLAIISYALCFLLISRGVDVSILLEKVGIQVSEASSSAGTAAIAYAVHKAASPIRFPPTVALTPVVATWLGKKNEGDTKKE